MFQIGTYKVSFDYTYGVNALLTFSIIWSDRFKLSKVSQSLIVSTYSSLLLSK